MKVVRTFGMNSEIAVIGFAQNGTNNPDAFIVVNTSENAKKVNVELHGTSYQKFEAFRIVDADESERYWSYNDFKIDSNGVLFEAAPGSVTTFFGVK